MKHPVLSAFFLQDGSEQRPKTPIFTGHSFGIDELEYSAAQGNLLKGIDLEGCMLHSFLSNIIFLRSEIVQNCFFYHNYNFFPKIIF